MTVYDVCNCFTVKVFVSNFKVEKVKIWTTPSTFFTFFDTSKKRKKSLFLDFQKNVKNVFSNYALEPNMKCIGSPVAEIWPLAYLGAYGTPILGEKGGRRVSVMAPFERAMVVSYRFSSPL